MDTPNSFIQKVQNAVVHLILRAPCHQHCTSLLQQLHWLPISERIKYKTACMCYTKLHVCVIQLSHWFCTLLESYLSELPQLYSPSLSLCSSSDTRMLKLLCFNRKTHGFRSFSYFGPHIWNNLPQDVRHSSLPFF